MSDTGYVVWFIVTAVVTAAILAIGTMIAADILPLPRRRHAPAEKAGPTTLAAVDGDVESERAERPAPEAHAVGAHRAA